MCKSIHIVYSVGGHQGSRRVILLATNSVDVIDCPLVQRTRLLEGFRQYASCDTVQFGRKYRRRTPRACVEVLLQLGDTSTPQFIGSKCVASVAASGVLVAVSGVAYDSSLFSMEITVSTKLLTFDGVRTKTSVSLISQVALVGQQHEAFGFQGRVVDGHMSVKLTRVTPSLTAE